MSNNKITHLQNKAVFRAQVAQKVKSFTQKVKIITTMLYICINKCLIEGDNLLSETLFIQL
ncbi:MAG: hypothetical protein H6Q20_920 [Bacteroidetes bacterium]|jgi:hypothetical protein|nr:hypothetical protein [Bacteroidota bacterium]